MTDLVPASEIESRVGARRHATEHLARAASAEQTVYNFDYTGRAALTGLPILPSLGVRAEL